MTTTITDQQFRQLQLKKAQRGLVRLEFSLAADRRIRELDIQRAEIENGGSVPLLESSMAELLGLVNEE